MATVEKGSDGPIVLMIDNETLDLGPRAVITQVGLCIANVETREYIVQPTNYWLEIEPQQEAGRTIGFDTVRWWLGQAEKSDVWRNVFHAPKLSDVPGKSAATGEQRVSPRWLFETIRYHVEFWKPVVYAAPAMFDLPMLTDLWGGRKPWNYRAERDMMTLHKLLDPTGLWRPPANGKEHDAAADAKWQMEYLFNLLALLKENNLWTPT